MKLPGNHTAPTGTEIFFAPIPADPPSDTVTQATFPDRSRIKLETLPVSFPL